MRIIYILLITGVFILQLSAQTITFNQRKTFGCANALFTSIEATDSCYYLTGFVRDSQNCQKSFLFVKMDTLGNVLHSNIISNPIGTYESWQPTLITNKEGNLVVVPYNIDTTGMSIGLWELDATGNLLKSNYYRNPYDTTRFIRGDGIVTTADSGYVITCTIDQPAQQPGGDVSILKVDRNGTIVWHVTRDLLSIDEHLPCVFLEEDGSIVIGYLVENEESVPKNFTIKSILEKLDTLGNTIWRYESPSTEQVWGANDLLKTKDGGWVVSSGLGSERPINVVSNQAFQEAYIYKLDSARNFLWGTKFHSDVLTDANFSKIIEEEDSSLIAFGTVVRLYPQPNPSHFIIHGRVVKLSPQGDSLWSREYEYLTTRDAQHYIYDAERTHDGGFLIAGECSGTGGGVFQQGWLLKLDGEGCLVPGCHLGLSVLPVGTTARVQVSLYPNPTSDYLNIYYQNRNSKKDLTFSVVDALGRVLDTYTTADISDKTYIFPVQDLASGLYFLEVRQDGKLLETQQFVKE